MQRTKIDDKQMTSHWEARTVGQEAYMLQNLCQGLSELFSN